MPIQLKTLSLPAAALLATACLMPSLRAQTMPATTPPPAGFPTPLPAPTPAPVPTITPVPLPGADAAQPWLTPPPAPAVTPVPVPGATPAPKLPPPTPAPGAPTPPPDGLPPLTGMPTPLTPPPAPPLSAEDAIGLPDPSTFTFPTTPSIPVPKPDRVPDPVSSVKMPPASSLALRLAPGAKQLRLEDAVRTAIQQNPGILNAIERIRQTRGQVVQVRAALLPTLNASSAYNQQSDSLANPRGSSGGSFTILGEKVEIPGAVLQDKTWNVTFQVTQSLWSGMKNQANFAAAKLSEDSAYYSLRQAIDQVIADTKTTFYEVIFNRALILVREQSVALLQSQLQDQQSRYEAGTVPRFNVLQAEVALANAIPPVIQARNALRISQFRLVKQLGMNYPQDPSTVPIDVVGQLDYNPIKIDLPASVYTALTGNPALKIQRQNILISAQQLTAAMSGFQPTFNANGGYLIQNDTFESSLGETVQGWFFGITGSWNIFDGLATVGATASARAALLSAKITYDDAVRQTELDVQQAVSNLIEAQETIDSQKASVVQATEALRLSRERLDAGAGTQLDVLNAQTSLLQAQTVELQARFQYLVALAQYYRVLSNDTAYQETFEDPLLTVRERKRAVALYSVPNPQPGVIAGGEPEAVRPRGRQAKVEKPAPTPAPQPTPRRAKKPNIPGR